MVGWRLVVCLGLAAVAAVAVGGEVTYDGRSLLIDGQRKLLFSGSIHYPRSTPDMWPNLITQAKLGGLDVIDTYVFWNIHEPQPGQYDFSGRGDIVRFIRAVQSQGLYVSLRIGPFIEGEWAYGGLPFWLHDVPGIVYRSNNEPFKILMQNFTTKIVDLMKSEKLYASQGGPIILSQIENEYQNVERGFRDKGPPYVRWAAAMALALDTGVPWVMCKQDDAPGPVINACNGLKCGETFVGPNSPNKPAIWTENWTQSFDVYGKSTRNRKPQDIAYHVALFIVKKDGSFINYYMYHGGTNFGRTASAFALTSYYDQAPLDEYGLIRQPKWGHLRELHAAVKLCSNTLLYGTKTIISFGALQQAYVYKGDKQDCAAFLVNTDGLHNADVAFQNATYRLPPKSISILPDCKTVAFNTAQVSTEYSTRTRQASEKLDSAEKWQEFNEGVAVFEATSLRSNLLMEQMNTTKDASDYLWYTASYEQPLELQSAVMRVNSRGHVLRAFVNGQLVDSGHGVFRNESFTLEMNVSLKPGVNNISLLSIMIGLPDSGAYMERRASGIAAVSIGDKDLSNYPWGYQVGLVGEKLQIYKEEGSMEAKWSNFTSSSTPLKWYKSKFDAPMGSDPVALNLGSMGKGQAWINGESIGRYWVSYLTPAGSPSQTWFHIPRSFLKARDNLLIVFEEENGNPLGISVDTVTITKVCGHVSQSSHPFAYSYKKQHGRRPRVHLHCPPNKNISNILFASFGSPLGDCTTGYALGKCHSPSSTSVVERACVGKWRCSVPWSNRIFGDPCPGNSKELLIEAECR